MSLDSPRNSRNLPRPLSTFLKWQVAMALLCGAMLCVYTFLLHRGYPYNFPYLKFNNFADFYVFQFRFQHFHHPDFFSLSRERGAAFSYPPPGSLLYEFFYLFPTHTHVIFLVLTTVPVLWLTVLLGRAMIRRGMGATTVTWFLACCGLLAFPFWFEFMLGNMEICIFLLIAAGILAWVRQHTYVAAVLIGIAGSMKLFPFVLLGLLLSRKQYRQFATALLTAAIVYPVSAWLECGSLAEARRGTAQGAAVLNEWLIYRYSPSETSFDHSIFGAFKQIKYILGYGKVSSSHELTAYVISAAVLGLLAYFFVIRHLPALNQILCLTIASIVLPPQSHDYTLMHMYVPWALMALAAVEASRRGEDIPGLNAAFAAMGFLLSYDSMLIIRGVGIAGELKLYTLVTLFYIGVQHPFPMPATGTVLEMKRVQVEDVGTAAA